MPLSPLALSLLLASIARAEAPIAPRLADDLALSWSNLGFSPAGLERAAMGPDVLAVGVDGRWALWDPVDGKVRSSEGEFAQGTLSSMAFDGDGALLLLDERARTLSRYEDGQATERWAADRMCPAGVSLVIQGGRAWGRDTFGRLHPIATIDPDREEPTSIAHVSRLSEGKLTVDGATVPVPADVLSGRVVGDWLVIEAGRPGALRARYAQSLTSGRKVSLPLLRDERYRPSHDVVAASDGSLAWMDARVDALHLHRVWP